MFKIGTQVSHPGHGACEITDICELDLTGEKVKYYRLIPYHGSSEVMYVPVANATKIGMRCLVTKEEANSLLGALCHMEEQWLSDSMAKQKRYRSLFVDNTINSLQDTLSAMSAIVRRKRQKELGSVDKTMLENIQRKVMSELAVALDISLEDAIQKAEDLILQPQAG